MALPTNAADPIDLTKLRGKLRQLERGDLLLMLERAIELVPNDKLAAVVADFIRPDDLRGPAAATSLLDDAREFSEDALAGKYYQSFRVDSRNCTQNSPGTDHFVADLDRLMGRVLKAVGIQADDTLREAFELLFAPLRRIDEGMDDVLFFGDEGGSWALGVVWDRVLPAYFQVLASTADPEAFARDVGRVVKDFVAHESLKFLARARECANEAQKLALEGLSKKTARR